MAEQCQLCGTGFGFVDRTRGRLLCSGKLAGRLLSRTQAPVFEPERDRALGSVLSPLQLEDAAGRGPNRCPQYSPVAVVLGERAVDDHHLVLCTRLEVDQ
jgi:hypothetical protein